MCVFCFTYSQFLMELHFEALGIRSVKCYYMTSHSETNTQEIRNKQLAFHYSTQTKDQINHKPNVIKIKYTQKTVFKLYTMRNIPHNTQCLFLFLFHSFLKCDTILQQKFVAQQRWRRKKKIECLLFWTINEQHQMK